jgi:hypothetical protein
LAFVTFRKVGYLTASADHPYVVGVAPDPGGGHSPTGENMKFLPIIVGVIAAALLLIGHLVQSLTVLNYIGTLLIIALVIILARGLSQRSSA